MGRSTTRLHIQRKPYTGKKYGFADYFSRYPISAAPPISDNDNNFVIHTKNALTHTLQNAQRVLTNHNARKTSKHNCVMKKESKTTQANTLFALIVTKFSRLLLQIIQIQIKSTEIPKHKLNVCTRNNPSRKTFEQKIERRYRSKNKMNAYPLQNIQSIINTDTENKLNQNTITIGTQTDETSNIRKGLEPLDPNWADNPFEITQRAKPLYYYLTSTKL